MLDCRLDALLHGPDPPAAEQFVGRVDAIHAEHGLLPHLPGSNPYLRCVSHFFEVSKVLRVLLGVIQGPCTGRNCRLREHAAKCLRRQACRAWPAQQSLSGSFGCLRCASLPAAMLCLYVALPGPALLHGPGFRPRCPKP